MSQVPKGRIAGTDKQFTWAEVSAEHGQIMLLFAKHSRQYARLNDRLKLCDAAWRHMCAMDEFDRRKVADELLAIVASPKDPQAHQNKFNPRLWLREVHYHFRRYHYSIEYYVEEDNHVLVTRLWFDRDMTGPDIHNGRQRHLLYLVKRTGDAKFSANLQTLGRNSKEARDALVANSWSNPEPAERVETRFAAVNGMKNNLTKASWLMGAHLDVAYPQGQFDQYTLFHNPTHGTFLDLWGCAWDKSPVTAKSTGNAQHLAAVLREAQHRGHRTHWVVHSRGAIVFCRAVKLAMLYHKDELNCHSVSLHAVGSNLADTHQACKDAGITISSARNNPYDMVPNLAGQNAISMSGLCRSLLFACQVVFGNDALASPHTFPYLGMDTFINQLNFSGHHILAKLASTFRPEE